MNLTELWVLFVVLPGLANACIAFACICVPLFIAAFACAIATDLEWFWPKFFMFLFPVLFIISVLGANLLPNKKEMALLISGQYLSNQEGLADVPKKSLKLLNQYLDEALGEEAK